MNDDRTTPDEQPAEPPPFQYKLRHLFVLILVICVFLALLMQWGLIGAYVFLLLLSVGAIVLGLATRRLWFVGQGTLAFLLLFFVGVVVIWGDRGAGESARRGRCMGQMRTIGLALVNYESANGSFPPAYIADKNGRPMHSWRVLILPYLDEQALYDQYDFDEPWDGPNNRKLADKMPEVFRCPCEDPKNVATMTNYLAVVGPRTVWPGDAPRKSVEITDGADKTIAVVEVADSGVHWMEPRDLHVTQMNPVINAKSGQGPSSKHAGEPGLAVVVFANGRVEDLEDGLDPQVLKALLTVDGGEEVDLDDL